MRTLRAPAPPLARTAVGLALSLAVLAGCSDGSGGRGGITRTTPPADASSSASPSDSASPDGTATDTTTQGTATDTTTSSAAQSGPSSTMPAAGSATAAASGYRVTYTTVTEKLPGGAKGNTTYPKVAVTAVTAGAGARVRTALENLVRSRVDGARQAFSSDVQELAQPGEDSEQKITVSREVRWGWLYAVQLEEYRYVAGAAHPLDNYLTVAVDLRSGRQVRTLDVFARIGPVDKVVRATLKARQPDADAEAVASVTVGEAPTNGSAEAESYPTAAGLWVGVSRCVLACALEPTEMVVPWRQLPATRPGALPRKV